MNEVSIGIQVYLITQIMFEFEDIKQKKSILTL